MRQTEEEQEAAYNREVIGTDEPPELGDINFGVVHEPKQFDDPPF